MAKPSSRHSRKSPAALNETSGSILRMVMGTHEDPNGDLVSKEMAEAFRGLRRNRHDLLDVDRLVDRIEYACRVYGVDMVVIDPVNEVDHVLAKGENKTDYMGRFIMKLKHIADDHNLLMICAAHPPKDSGAKAVIQSRLHAERRR